MTGEEEISSSIVPHEEPDRDNGLVPGSEAPKMGAITPAGDEGLKPVPVPKDPVAKSELVPAAPPQKSVREAPRAVATRPTSAPTPPPGEISPFQKAQNALQEKIWQKKSKIHASPNQPEKKPKEEEEGTESYSIPIVDLPLPILVSPLLDLTQDMESVQNQARLVLVERIAKGDFNKPVISLFDLVDRLRSLHESFGPELVPNWSELDSFFQEHKTELGYMALEDIEPKLSGDSSSVKILSDAASTLNSLFEKIRHYQALYQQTPSLLPWFRQNTYDKPVNHCEAIGFVIAHFAQAKVDKEASKQHQKRVMDAQNFPPINRLGAVAQPISLSRRYMGDPRILPPSPMLTDDSDDARTHIIHWLRSYPPQALLTDSIRRHRPILAAFKAEGLPNHVGSDDIQKVLRLLRPDGIGDQKLSMPELNAMHLRMAEQLGRFYTIDLPRLLLVCANEMMQQIGDESTLLLSQTMDWIAAKGPEIFDSMSTANSHFMNDMPFSDEELAHLPSESLSISIVGILEQLRRIEAKFANLTSPPGPNDPDLAVLKAINPDFSIDTMGKFELSSEAFLDELVKIRVLQQAKDGFGYEFKEGYSEFITLGAASQILFQKIDSEHTSKLLQIVKRGSLIVEQSQLTKAVYQKYLDTSDPRERMGQIAWLLPRDLSGMYTEVNVTRSNGSTIRQWCANGNDLTYFSWSEAGERLTKRILAFDTDAYRANAEKVRANVKSQQARVDKIAEIERDLTLSEEREKELLVTIGRQRDAIIRTLRDERAIVERVLQKYQSNLHMPVADYLNLLENDAPAFLRKLSESSLASVFLNDTIRQESVWGGFYMNALHFYRDFERSYDEELAERKILELKLLDLSAPAQDQDGSSWMLWSQELVRPYLSSVALSILSEPKDAKTNTNNAFDSAESAREQTFTSVLKIINELDQMIQNKSGSLEAVQTLLSQASQSVANFERLFQALGDDDDDNNDEIQGASERRQVDNTHLLPRGDVALPFDATSQGFGASDSASAAENLKTVLASGELATESLRQMLVATREAFANRAAERASRLPRIFRWIRKLLYPESDGLSLEQQTLLKMLEEELQKRDDKE